MSLQILRSARTRILAPSGRGSLYLGPVLTPRRFYASRKGNKEAEKDKNKNKRAPLSTDTLVPGSKLRISEAALEEYSKCNDKMNAAVEWYRKEVAGLENRVSGRVSPALLSPVRVALPDRGSERLRLEEIATVGVKDGSVLIVTVFEENVSNR